ERSFFWRLTGRANLSYFGRLFDLDNDLLKRRIEELSRLLDLEGLLERRYDRCSAGMKQRIALARSLLTGPSVLLLDEPTRSLDPIQAGRLVHLLRRIASEEKIAILASSHQLEYLSEYTDRTGLLLEGRLVEMKSSLGQASGEVVVRIGGDGDEIARFVKLWGGVEVEDSEPGIRRLSFQTGLVSSRKGGWKEFLGQLSGSELEIIDLRTHRSDIRLLYEQTLSEAARPAQASDSPVLPTISKQPGELSIGSARAEERTYSVSRPRRSAWLKALDLLFVEAQTWLSYRFNLIFGLIGLLFFLAGFAFVSRLIGESGQESLARYGTDYFTFVVVGIAFAGLQSVALNSLAGMIRKHQQLGTLEFLMLSATPFDRILLASTLISFFGVLGTMTGYIVVGDVVFNADFSRLNLVASLGVFGLSVAAILGFGLLSAGAVMVLKRADALLFYLHSLMLFFGGVFFPIEMLPSWLQAISRLLPITYALSALRKTMITGAGLPEVG
ncbi:MAG: ABC transporter ATP-binding protein/permease, partial [Candidatus Krumholzibacteria bacterium]|nr:ABC transporter ATP-binding protein/permease [Candidatus Krumholzibacteria bacterium]